MIYMINFINKTMKQYKVTIDEKGTTRWYNIQDQLHREEGPAIECSNGTKSWWVNDQRHREEGPAIEWSNGSKEWYLNSQRHREDGPAVEWSDGSKEWYLNNQRLTEEQWRKRTQTQTCAGKTVVIDGKTYKLVILNQ